MITITLSDRTLASSRMATTALSEVVGSLYLLGRGGLDWPYLEWAERARAALGRPECEPLAYLATGPRILPDFIDVYPVSTQDDLDAELVRLQDVDPACVRDELCRMYGDAVPPGLAPYAADTAGALAKLAAAYDSYWRRAMAPVWPAVRDVFDAEVLRRGRMMAMAGADGLFGGLDNRLCWQRPELKLDLPHALEIDARDRELILIPLVFVVGRMFVTGDERAVYLGYHARGAARLADSRPAAAPLALLFGAGRARVIEALVEPVSLRALAHRLGLAPSTVSQHLDVLVRAGMVGRQRAGHRVYYELNDLGRDVMGRFG